MQYFEKQNLAFFHIHKTGGSSFRELLKRNLGDWKWIAKNVNHEPLSIKKEVMGKELFNNTNIVTIIRNPIDVVVSYYTAIYSTSLSKHNKLRPHVVERAPHLIEVYNKPFNEFVDWYMNCEKTFTYDEYLLIDDKLPNNLYIIKFENLKVDINKILNKKLNLDININLLPRWNVSTVKKPVIDDISKNKIISEYKWVFDMGFYKRGCV